MKLSREKKSGRNLLFVILTIAAVTITACGPDQSSQGLEEQQIRDNINTVRQTLAPFEGAYTGYLDQRDPNTRKVVGKIAVALTLTISEPTVQNAGRNETTVTPKLMGKFYLCANPNNCFEDISKNTGYDLTDVTPTDQGRISIFAGQSGTVSGAAVVYQIYARFDGTMLKGDCKSGQNLQPSHIELKRVN